ncbi:MAG TPA: pitrilysin family protein [Steroidobacteraceae bacterium]|nr:pitrilysin family protein [Steroidobacteraceae bacterium]
MIGRLLMKVAAATSMIAPMAAGSWAAPGGTGVRVPPHERIVLDNGLTLIIVPRRDVPLVAFNAVLRGGASADMHGKPGVASLVAGLLEKGAGSRDAFEFADAVEGVGGSFGAAAGTEAIIVRGQFLARDQELMLELLSDALLSPRLDPEELDVLRQRQVELIKAAKDSDPSELIGMYGRAFLFGDHPYGRPVIGSERSLGTVTHQDVLRYYGEHFGADRLTLIVSGDVDSSWLKRAVIDAFGSWGEARRPLALLPAPVRARERQVLLVDSPGSAQTYFWIGAVGVGRKYPDRAALELVNTLYGGRFTSILNTELRVKSGLSYGARSGFMRGSVAGEFSIRSFAQTEETTKAIELALATLRRLRHDGVTGEMLDSARAYVTGQYPMSFETAADWAAELGEVELYRLGTTYIDDYGPALHRVTLQDARRVIDGAFPAADRVALVVIGDAARIRSELTAYGAVTEMSLIEPVFDSRARHVVEPAAVLQPIDA